MRMSNRTNSWDSRDPMSSSMTASVSSRGWPKRSCTTLDTRIIASLSRTVFGSRAILSMNDPVTAVQASSFMGKS